MTRPSAVTVLGCRSLAPILASPERAGFLVPLFILIYKANASRTHRAFRTALRPRHRVQHPQQNRSLQQHGIGVVSAYWAKLRAVPCRRHVSCLNSTPGSAKAKGIAGDHIQGGFGGRIVVRMLPPARNALPEPKQVPCCMARPSRYIAPMHVNDLFLRSSRRAFHAPTQSGTSLPSSSNGVLITQGMLVYVVYTAFGVRSKRITLISQIKCRACETLDNRHNRLKIETAHHHVSILLGLWLLPATRTHRNRSQRKAKSRMQLQEQE